MPVSERDAHQRVLVTLIGRLQFWQPEGELRTAPTEVVFDEENLVVPDIFWVGEHNERCQVDEDGVWRGAPDLIVEVVATDSEAQDRGDKFSLYQTHQVFEYWIVNPLARFIEVFVMLNKRLIRTGLYQLGDSFSSGVLNGRVFEVNDLFGIKAEDID